MKKIFMFSIALVLLLFVFPDKSEAQDVGAGASATNVTEYDFEDDLVTGDLVRPDGDLVGARRKAKVSSLIRVRKNFIPEILKSVENL